MVSRDGVLGVAQVGECLSTPFASCLIFLGVQDDKDGEEAKWKEETVVAEPNEDVANTIGVKSHSSLKFTHKKVNTIKKPHNIQ